MTDRDVVVWRSLDNLRVWARNYRQGDVGAICESIRRFGFNGVLRVWREGTVVAGNHTLLALLALRKEGWQPAGPGLASDWQVATLDVSGLDALEAEAFAVADNRTAELALVREDVLVEHLQRFLEDDSALLRATGYDEADVDDLIRMLGPPSLDDLAKKYGEPGDRDFWPVIRVQVSPETFEAYESLMGRVEGDEAARFEALINAIDTAAL